MSAGRSTHGENQTRPDRHDPERDLVTFYSRLTQTLEKNLGADDLARRLVDLRQAGADQPVEIREAAAVRVFRRLGWLAADDDAAAFLTRFRHSLAGAVSRPSVQVDEMLRLFCTGNNASGVKPVCGPTPYCQKCGLTRACDYFNNPRKPVLATLTPSQRLLTGHVESLSDAELLGVALYGDKATGNEKVVANLLSRYGRLRAVFRAEPGEFAAIRDVGPAMALRLSSYSALYRRLLVERRDALLRVGSARDIYDRYAAELREYKVEAAVLLMLD